jgi:hypothetical protein
MKRSLETPWLGAFQQSWDPVVPGEHTVYLVNQVDAVLGATGFQANDPRAEEADEGH